MKVLLINGSPHENGCTYTALYEVAKPLQNLGVLVEFFYIGTAPVYGCAACGSCNKKRGACAYTEDRCNALIQAAEGADGIVIGSPVYYSGPNGALCALLDRAFFAGREAFHQKPGAVVLSCRRSGGTAAFDRLNKYLTINQMPVVSSQYWNVVHGTTSSEVRQDLEGMQIMRVLGKNMAWLLNSLKLSRSPAHEPRVGTNFIR
ncbi:MAG: flavodoxin family protein [Treponema sp.]|jgi:multimeric flavodoxin WrbA|nr:flavodoxin family protein [Treponema sp.]